MFVASAGKLCAKIGPYVSARARALVPPNAAATNFIIVEDLLLCAPFLLFYGLLIRLYKSPRHAILNNKIVLNYTYSPDAVLSYVTN